MLQPLFDLIGNPIWIEVGTLALILVIAIIIIAAARSGGHTVMKE
jgi:hypothetical protein